MSKYTEYLLDPKKDVSFLETELTSASEDEKIVMDKLSEFFAAKVSIQGYYKE